MNKFIKIMFAILGGVNTAFSLVSPLLIVLLIISLTTISPVNQFFVLAVALMSSAYRALAVLIE